MNYMLYKHDVTCNMSRWNNGGNYIYKKGQQKLTHLEKIVFFNKKTWKKLSNDNHCINYWHTGMKFQST